uniref:Uncharacterized protein n=1 Tax=Anopheles farauti TaxID=69004 RepID=A0A182QHU1_9DIPT
MQLKLALKFGLAWCLLAMAQAREENSPEECEKNIAASLKDRICELRQYATVEGEDMDKHVQCVLEFQEVLGLLKIVDPNLDHAVNIKKCDGEAATVDASKKANTFYTCFLGTSSAPTYKVAMDFVKLIRAGKMHVEGKFDAGEVAARIKEVDDGLCK